MSPPKINYALPETLVETAIYRVFTSFVEMSNALAEITNEFAEVTNAIAEITNALALLVKERGIRNGWGEVYETIRFR